MSTPSYQYYNQLLKGIQLPAAFLDLDLLDKNIEDLRIRAGNKTIRVASKSVRCTYVLDRILKSHPQYQGIMCYSGWEAIFLSEQGFDDLLLGYPIVNEAEITAICKATKAGKKIVLMVDDEQHFALVQKIAATVDVVQPVCIDLDMSSDFPGLHFGVNRSPVRDVATFKKLVDAAAKYPMVKIAGLMGYEAQIAGLGDTSPYNGVKNYVIPFLKRRSIHEISQRRKECVAYLTSKGYKDLLVNGGGTGSMESTKVEDWVTEITVGSGFYSPGLFDYYKKFHHLPAAGYAVQIVRRPAENMYTCLGGGYVASGTIGLDKQPKPYLPEGIQLTDLEGTGEVQTPFTYKGPEKIDIGDTILFRHSKAGELCERFNYLQVISKGAIVEKVPTYRGQGQCFL